MYRFLLGPLFVVVVVLLLLLLLLVFPSTSSPSRSMACSLAAAAKRHFARSGRQQHRCCTLLKLGARDSDCCPIVRILKHAKNHCCLLRHSRSQPQPSKSQRSKT